MSCTYAAAWSAGSWGVSPWARPPQRDSFPTPPETCLGLPRGWVLGPTLPSFLRVLMMLGKVTMFLKQPPPCEVKGTQWLLMSWVTATLSL